MTAKLPTGMAGARFYCQTCHLFPEPDLLDKKTWIEQTLPRMKIRMGLAPEMIDQHPEGKLLRASGIFPEQPLLPESIFDSIVD